MTSHRYRKVKHPRGATPVRTKNEVKWRGQAYLKDPTTVVLGTQADNMRDMQERGRRCAGERHPASKLTNAQRAYIRQNYKPYDREFGSRALAATFGVSHKVVQRYAKTHVH